tara:strand:+ start:194 stop:562 length:369 start_codon:yes stop_codon:yes gene_type:complete
MKLTSIPIIIILSLITTSCSKNSTKYNGYIKNATDSIINLKIIGDDLLFDSISIGSGLTEKIYHFKEDGDFEIYDCTSFFDSIYFETGDVRIAISSDSASITTTSYLESNEIRIHNCIIGIE